MQLPVFLRKKLIIFLAVILVVVSVGVWFFFFRDQDSSSSAIISDTAPIAQETPDEIRIRQINLIQKSIDVFVKRGDSLPLPANALDITFGTTPLVSEGRIPSDFYDKIGLESLLDPRGEGYFYALSGDKKTYQIMALVNSKDTSNTVFGDIGAYVAGTGKDLFFTDKDNVLFVTKKLDTKSIDISDNASRTKIGLEIFKSCLDINNSTGLFNLKSGVYTIDIDGKDTKVFCDLETDGGGWTLFYANNGHPDSPIQKSYLQMRETMSGEAILDLSNYDDPNLAGLLNFSHFTQQGAKEILIKNRVGDAKKWVKFIFSNPHTLEWALGPDILGKTESGCIDIPRRATWSIVNGDKKVIYNNLTQIMSHRGTSWGVSHEKYPCNNYLNSINPQIAFYNARDDLFSSRTRSGDGIGGDWGGGNEYRYFIR